MAATLLVSDHVRSDTSIQDPDRACPDPDPGPGPVSQLNAPNIRLVLRVSSTLTVPVEQSYKMVRTEYERREEGFLALGSYFDGSNSAGLRLNETQPIIMRHDQRRVRTSCFARSMCAICQYAPM